MIGRIKLWGDKPSVVAHPKLWLKPRRPPFDLFGADPEPVIESGIVIEAEIVHPPSWAAAGRSVRLHISQEDAGALLIELRSALRRLQSPGG